MQSLELTLTSPAENLALDEALLESAEAGEIGAVLRFWESSQTFVALGYTNRAQTEVDLEWCQQQNIPILRRVSGGGTVLQGPGCLNYALVIPIQKGEEMNVGCTNCYVMGRQKRALGRALGKPVDIAGHTDLAWEGRKFSGNAQRRKSKFLLFHGTILLNFDLELLARALKFPSKEPDYRAGRSHGEFVQNLGIEAEKVKTTLTQMWNATRMLNSWPGERVARLVEEKYARDEWNLKF